METPGLPCAHKNEQKIFTEGVRKKKFDAAMQTEKKQLVAHPSSMTTSVTLVQTRNQIASVQAEMFTTTTSFPLFAVTFDNRTLKDPTGLASLLEF